MEPSRIADTIHEATKAAEQVLLRVEELELLVSADRPRRLIEMAQADLSEAISYATELWEAQDSALAETAAGSDDQSVQAAWQDFKSLLATSAERSAEASTVIAGRLAVAEDVMSTLGIHREYGRDAGVRDASAATLAPRPVLA